MSENSQSKQAFDLYKKSLKKTIKKNKDFNPYELRYLSDFKDIVDYMRSSSSKTNGNIYKFIYNRKICKNNFKTFNRDYNDLVIFYINFFLNDVPMTIVYALIGKEFTIDYVRKPDIMDPKRIKLYFHFKPIAYSENAVDKNGKPFDIDFLVENAGLKQLKTNVKMINNRKVTPLFQNMFNGRYMLSNNPNDLKGLDTRSEIFVIPNYCFGSMFNKPDIAHLMSDFKNTVEEMKWDPDPSMISFTGEYVREAEKKWDENIGNDLKRTKTRGGKNNKTNKIIKNKRDKTRKVIKQLD